MVLKSIANMLRRDDSVYREMKIQDDAAAKLQNRKLSHEELMLMKIQNKRRQEAIKKQVDLHIKREERAYWRDNRVIGQPNMFSKQKNIFNHQPSVLK